MKKKIEREDTELAVLVFIQNKKSSIHQSSF